MNVNLQAILLGILIAAGTVVGIGSGIQYGQRFLAGAQATSAFGEMQSLLGSAEEFYITEGNTPAHITANSCAAVSALTNLNAAYTSLPQKDSNGNNFEICYFPSSATATTDFAVYDPNSGGTSAFPAFTLNNVTYDAALTGAPTVTPTVAQPPQTCATAKAKCVFMLVDAAVGQVAGP